MYLNVIKLKNGHTLRVYTWKPCTDLIVNGGWNELTDCRNDKVVSFRGLDVESIVSYYRPLKK